MRKVLLAGVLATAAGATAVGVTMASGGQDAEPVRLVQPAAGTAKSDQAGSTNSAPQAYANSSARQAPLYPASLRVVGLTSDQRLVAFRSNSPGAVASLGKVSGLKGDRKLVGIDYRVQNTTLYGVGDQGGIYTFKNSAYATKVSQLTVALQGKNFGVDFNPAANRLRVISDTGQNLRHNIDDPAGAPAAGATATDGTLTNPPVPPATAGATATDVTGAGYTNNDLEANTATTLFDLDTALDQTSVQSPANAGNLAPTGKLRTDVGPNAGFDVYYSAAAGTNTGFAALQAGSGYRFFRINLLTGRAIPVGAFPSQHQVVDIALPLNQG